MSSIEERLHDELTAAVDEVSVDPVALARTATRRGRRRRRRAVTASVVLPAVAVGTVVAVTVALRPDPGPISGGWPSGPVLLEDGQPLLTCNTPDRFTPSVARNGLPRENPVDFVPAMQQHAAAEAWSIPETLRRAADIARADWRVAAVSEHTALILFGAVNNPTTFSFEKSGSGWKVSGMGGCRNLRTVPSVSTRSWVDVSTGGTAGLLSRSSKTIKLNVIGSFCTDEPPLTTLVETTTAVTVYPTERRTSEGCVGAARLQVVTVTLSAPLGSRPLLDGTVWPIAAVHAQ